MCVRRVLRARSASLGEYQLLMEKHPRRGDRTGGWITSVYGDESGEIGSRDVQSTRRIMHAVNFEARFRPRRSRGILHPFQRRIISVSANPVPGCRAINRRPVSLVALKKVQFSGVIIYRALSRVTMEWIFEDGDEMVENFEERFLVIQNYIQVKLI